MTMAACYYAWDFDTYYDKTLLAGLHFIDGPKVRYLRYFARCILPRVGCRLTSKQMIKRLAVTNPQWSIEAIQHSCFVTYPQQMENRRTKFLR